MTLDEQGTVSLLKKYEKESKAIKEEILRLCWYMRGSVSYDDAMLLSDDERNIITKIINDNLKIAKDSGQPFF